MNKFFVVSKRTCLIDFKAYLLNVLSLLENFQFHQKKLFAAILDIRKPRNTIFACPLTRTYKPES